ncbi:MAG: sigma-54-dependent Fis family transcriptional regulator [Deltaproteobacteria bacterium]|nr:sigma-54-dependent Fis family transcriptional regulator [Deltaproteobacteria bacterium]
MSETILIVDDELDMLNLLKRSLEPDLKCRVDTVPSAEEALKRLEINNYDLILVDMKMPGMDGMQFLRIVKNKYPDITVVMMTAFGDIDITVKAMKRGAYDFIAKPFEHDALLLRLEKALERSRLKKENLKLQQECFSDNSFQNMVGKSSRIMKVFESIQMVANTDLTVLITGESGTGKDLTARAIHALSPRKKAPFISINCPTLPENILESELFGYKKGAFTNAVRDRKGLFQEADTGTIFLDEIGDISPTIQTKLLRVLQEKEIKPLGETKSITVDVRIIASTNRILEDKIENDEFREDFFYRLNVLPIKLPSLKDRREDIPLIANYLLEKYSTKLKKPLKPLSRRAMEIFLSRTWKGNVREMENIIIQGILYSAGDEIRTRDMGLSEEIEPVSMMENTGRNLPYKEAKEQTLQQFNAAYIGHILSANKGNVSKAARKCGLERQALQQIMRRYGIKAEIFRQ